MYEPTRLHLRDLTVSKSKSFAFIVSVLFFLFSLYVYPFYTAGDQNFYRLFYDDANSEGFVDSFFSYQNLLGSSEPGYFLLVKVFSSFIQKDLLMSLLNAALVYNLLLWSNRKRVYWFVVLLLCMNFYLLVLLFAAERLKFAMLLLMIAVNANGLRKPFYAASAFLTHTQTALLIVNWITARAMPALRKLMAGKLERDSWKILALLLICMAVLTPMISHVQSKFEVYSETGNGFSELIKPAAFILLTLIYARGQRLDALAMHFPVAAAAFLVGGNRTVIFSYFIFLIYALQYRRGLNAGVVITSIYFILQAYEFLQNIFVYGNGFPSI